MIGSARNAFAPATAAVAAVSADTRDSATIVVANVGLHADATGALFWPEQSALIVAESRRLGAYIEGKGERADPVTFMRENGGVEPCVERI